MPAADDLPLAGIRVLELTSWMAAPSAGAILADLGADVVKLEPLRGDPMRGMSRQPKREEGEPERDEPFHVDNRGKRSITVAIDQPDGAALVRRLVADRDVFLTNLLPRRQERYGLDPDSLFAVRPQLVHATLSGYGRSGPEAGRPGYDVTAFFGRGGISDSSIEPGGPLPAPRPAQGDHTTGLALVAGILAALRRAERTGEGQAVDASLFGTAVWTMATDYAAAVIDHRNPSKRDRRHLITPLANRFRCADDRWVVVNMPEQHWWPVFCKAVGLESLLDDERLQTTKGRFDNMPELIDTIDAVMATRPLAEWARIFDDVGMIWGPANTLADVVADPQAHAERLFPEITMADGTTFPTVAIPFKIRGAAIGPQGPAPELGAHTAEVLGDAGVTAAELDDLRSRGVIG
ncbi:MAG: CoA transferase [Actinobacteria bacterium]|nr:CoA transferase [Actinomycetota bacterium]